MGASGTDVTAVLVPVALLLLAAHMTGHWFALLGQPRVIGEIVGGLLLGPTVLGAIAPGLQAALFPQHGQTAAVLGWVVQLGLLLLMFCSGVEMRALISRTEARVVGLVATVGVVVPFALGVVVLRFVDASALMGRAHSHDAVVVVFSLAVAVTSIPVIARILFDLGVIESSFARVVLGVAVLEDLVVYVVLAATLGAVGAHGFGLPVALGLDAAGFPGLAYHVAATLLVFVVMLTAGASAFAWSGRQRWNLVARGNAVAYQLLLLFAGTLACLALGITPMFGAFLAGIAVTAERDEVVVEARSSIKAFSFAFFVPLYFAMVGEQLDLRHHLDLVFLAWFVVFASLVKSASVLVGARLAGESARTCWNLAVATNARGGPCIVLASVTYAAGLISADFYTALVLLAMITSMVAGTVLGRAVRRGEPLRAAPNRLRVDPVWSPPPDPAG